MRTLMGEGAISEAGYATGFGVFIVLSLVSLILAGILRASRASRRSDSGH